MIDLDKLQKVSYRAIEIGAEKEQLFSAEEVISVFNILRKAEKDAARYRWLRDESALTHDNAPLAFFTDTNGDQIAFDFDGSSYSVLHDEMLDAAIDEAMQCNK